MVIHFELAIKRFSLAALRYQPYFNTSSRIYVVYVLTIHNNRSYFNTYCLYWLIPTKHKQKTIDPDFYQARIVRLSYLLRLFVLAYRQTISIIFLHSSFLISRHLSAISNKILPFMIFLHIKQRNILSVLCIFFLTMKNLFISINYVVHKVPK